MAGLTREEFDRAAREIQEAWSRAGTRDAGLAVIVEYGRKYGYKNVMAAIQGKVPKQFTREKTVDEFIAEGRQEETDE